MHFLIPYVFAGFTQKPKKFQPPFKGLNASSSKINRFYSFNDEERRFEETQGDCTSNLRGNNGCSGDEGLKDYPDGSFLSGGAVKFRSIFSEFPFFNYVQSKALDDVLYTNKNFVACAPTGSGKTVLFELAIIRLLMETQEPWRDVKAVYMAPIKALCSQCYDSWSKKFGPLGLTCKELTGDTEIDDLFEIHDSHIILTTPEKWDSMSRKWKDSLLQLVRLFLIDEVHVVKDATRGATLEVVVSRMKAVNSYRTSQNPEAGVTMRLVAVSATIPNICDVMRKYWLYIMIYNFIYLYQYIYINI
uniref:Helicase for meiosis 1 n=1 Tax=Poecilia reticulata TaxID=8081 RepID=A0A3P9NPU6_POERE